MYVFYLNYDVCTLLDFNHDVGEEDEESADSRHERHRVHARQKQRPEERRHIGAVGKDLSDHVGGSVLRPRGGADVSHVGERVVRHQGEADDVGQQADDGAGKEAAAGRHYFLYIFLV